MIIALVGIYDDYEVDDTGSSRGGGKTTSMVYYLDADYEEGRYIFTNFWCSFAKVLPAQKIVDEILAHPEKYKKDGVSVGLTEFQTVLGSLGSGAKQVLFLNYWVTQTRKLNVDLYYDLQRFRDANNRVRAMTDNVLKPRKYHADGKPCRMDRCTEHHYVKIFSEKPYRVNPLTGNEVIDTWLTGKMYNTNELIFDALDLPDKGKRDLPIEPKIDIIKKTGVETCIICPECTSKNIVKMGKTRYVCYDCEYQFNLLI